MWAYSALFSCLLIAMGVGILRGGSLNQNFGSRQWGPQIGFVPLAVGSVLFASCVFKAIRAK